MIINRKERNTKEEREKTEKEKERRKKEKIGGEGKKQEAQRITGGVICTLLKNKPTGFEELEFTCLVNIFLLCTCSFSHCIRQETFNGELYKEALFPQRDQKLGGEVRKS